MDIIGILKTKGIEQQVSEKFKKREFVITLEGSSQYPQHIQLEFTQDKCGILDNYKIGQEIKVHFNVRGREWVSKDGELKYFNTLQAWKIELASSDKNSEYVAPTSASPGYSNDGDHLPF